MRVDTCRAASPVPWAADLADAWEVASPDQGEAFAPPAVAFQKASLVALQEDWMGQTAYPAPSAAAYLVSYRARGVAGQPAAYGEAEGIEVLS